MDSVAKRVVVIVAFHFLPSPEVGAKRMTSLASYLAARGDRVVVVSTFDGLDFLAANDPRRSALGLFHLERLPVRRARITAAIVRIKRILSRGLRPLLSANNSSSSNQGPSQAIAAGQSAVLAVHRGIFSVLHAVDDKKRWALDAYRRVSALSGPLQPTAVIVSGPPMSPLLGAVLAGKRRRVPVIVDLRDPIIGVDGAIPLQGWFDKTCRKLLERFLVRHATHITTTSGSLRDYLSKQYSIGMERLACIPNGYDGEPAPQRIATGHDLVIVYAGTLYMNRNPFPLLEAIDRLLAQCDTDSSRIHVIFAGECDQYAGVSLREWSANRPCGRVLQIKSRLDADELVQLYNCATLLINFAEGQRMQIPAKTFEVLARGREVLTLCEPDSDTAALVYEIPGVFVASSDDGERLRSLLRDIYERHVRQGVMLGVNPYDIAHYSRVARNQEMARLLDEAEGKLVRQKDNTWQLR